MYTLVMDIRINRYLAERGHCSRRQADELILKGVVSVNGAPVKPGAKVSETDTVSVNGKTISSPARLTYILLNKPVGYISTTDRRAEDTVLDLVPRTVRLYPVGRLDVNSSGLLILTNDGALTNRLTHPRYEHEKEYEVQVDKSLTEDALSALRTGVILDRKKTLPAKVKKMRDRSFVIALRQGRNRQIRRMCESLGYTVTALRRTRVLSLTLDNLGAGQWRYLTNEEVMRLRSDAGIV